MSIGKMRIRNAELFITRAPPISKFIIEILYFQYKSFCFRVEYRKNIKFASFPMYVNYIFNEKINENNCAVMKTLRRFIHPFPVTII